MYTITVICAQEVAVTSILPPPLPGSVISFLTWSEVVSFFTDKSRLAKILC